MKVYYINISKMLRIILTASLFGLVALFLTAALLMPAGNPVNTGAGVICKVKTDEKIAALTFNMYRLLSSSAANGQRITRNWPAG